MSFLVSSTNDDKVAFFEVDGDYIGPSIVPLDFFYSPFGVGFKAQAGKSVDGEARGQPVAESLYHLTE